MIYVCKTCGAEFAAKPCRKRLYCSIPCRDIAWRDGNHPRYSGGGLDTAGYRVICLNGRRDYEHRLVMESMLGRRLLATELVHHLDGNRTNNDPSNLRLVAGHASHKLTHSPYRDDTYKECTHCHQVKPRSEFHKATTGRNRDRHNPQCKECRNSSRRKTTAPG